MSYEQIDDFMFLGAWVPVDSSNLVAAQYDSDGESLVIEYQGGTTWRYSSVSEAEARDFAQAGSHGEWVWDHIKVRGTKDQHQKPAVRVAGVSRKPLRVR